MDPITVGEIGLALLATVWGGLKTSGIVGKPDWVKYVDAGVAISEKALQIIAETKSGSKAYDKLSPDQIREVLKPPSWDELVAQVAKEMKP